MSDLIIEGAKGIPDGLYVIKDGELFKYKPNGGTVYTARAYHVTDRPKGEWVYHEDYKLDGECCYECSECGRMYDYKMNYCGHCGADMRGGEDE